MDTFKRTKNLSSAEAEKTLKGPFIHVIHPKCNDWTAHLPVNLTQPNHFRLPASTLLMHSSHVTRVFNIAR